MLAVGVERDDDLRPSRHQPVPGAKRGAAAAVDHVAGTTATPCSATSPVPSREPSSTTRTSVPARRLRRDRRGRAEIVLLVVGGNDDRDLAAEALRQACAAELLPGDSLERAGEFAADPGALRERRRTSRKRIRIAKTATPMIRSPLPR